MKKYILLIIAAIFCLPNTALAQYRSSNSRLFSSSTTSEREMRDQNRRNNKFFGESKAYQSAKKPKVKIPARDIHRAIEVVTNDTTGVITARWDDGSTYIGEIYYGELKGMGTLTLADGGKYHGQWRFDRFHGVGSMVCADGSKYTGEWQLGKPHGKGTFINPEGVAFIGEFYDGAPNGKGIIQDVDGRKYTARWKDGKLKEKSIKPLEEK